MCSQPASEPWAEPHRAVPDPATRPHHHPDATRPSGVLTPNNADYTTGNVIARRRRVRFGEGPSGNRIVMHAAARGLRRPGDSPAVQQHLPRCSHRDPGNRSNDAIRPRPPALSGRSWTRARGSRLRAPPNSSRGGATPRYSPKRESTGRSSTGRAAGAFGGVCRRLKRMARYEAGPGGFALQRQLEVDQRRHAEAAHAPLQALTAGRRALTALRGCGADAGPSGALAARDHRRGPRRGSAPSPGGSPALRVAARSTNRARAPHNTTVSASAE